MVVLGQSFKIHHRVVRLDSLQLNLFASREKNSLGHRRGVGTETVLKPSMIPDLRYGGLRAGSKRTVSIRLQASANPTRVFYTGTAATVVDQSLSAKR